MISPPAELRDAVPDESILRALVEMFGSEGSDEILDAIVDDMPNVVSSLEDGLLRGDAKKILLYAHSLKSTSTMVGAFTLVARCEAVEAAALAGDVSLARVQVPLIVQEYRQLAGYLTRRGAGLPASPLGAVPAHYAPEREAQRLACLRESEILDTPQEQCFDELVQLAADICRTPIAGIGLIDERRQWFKARVGIAAAEVPREISFCAHAIRLTGDVMEVSDTRLDSRFAANPMVVGEPRLRFYASAHILSAEGLPMGTLLVAHTEPQRLLEHQRRTLLTLARTIGELMQARRQRRQQRQAGERDELVVRAATDAVWDWHIADDRLWWNEGLDSLLGWTREQLDAGVACWYDGLHADDRRRVVDGLHAVIHRTDGGDAWHGEYRARHRDGHYLHLLHRAVVMRDASGNATRVVGGLQRLSPAAPGP